ncbi:hypothetical protein C7S18_23710 (plasmid) [Ahniella affigens]|uniref:Uncharacterized protein n=1 Tax=Ahniella affigens TaxID=2021234 RepID=A0A2P1PZP8_9GAMM|nr:hypothetical protein [Ahniella affigens]AVQ00307.1 hypothetical protein C7S18_23710 [Ahniella affigens]
MNAQKGFSLVAFALLLGLVTIAGVAGVQLQLRESRAKLAQSWIDAQARELEQIAVAVRTWTSAPTNVASWPNDTRVGIACTSLTSAGLLPASFGRDTVPCKGPFGTTYTMIGIKNAADTTVPVGRVRIVIYQTGQPGAGLLKRAGITNDTAGMTGIAMRTALALSERKIPAGWVVPGNATATGVGRAWTKPLANWITPAPTYAGAVALVGFPDLGGILDTTASSADRCTAGEIVRGFCSGNPLCLNNGQGWVPPVCPSGKSKVGEFPHCKTNDVFQYNSGLGSSLILGNVTFDLGQGRGDSECASYARQFGLAGSEEYTTARDACRADHSRQFETTIYVDGPQPNNFCGIEIPGFAPNPVYPGQQVLATSTQLWGYPAGKDIVCATCN